MLKIIEFLAIFILGFASHHFYFRLFKKNKTANKPINTASNNTNIDSQAAVATWLDELLPKRSYTILKNVIIPGQRFEIDFVIVGPKGIIVFEAKNFTGQVCFSDDEYFKIVDGKKQVLPFGQDPRTQIKQHVNLLRKYFEDRGFFNLVISKAIVFAKDNSTNLIGKPGVYIINGQDSLINYINRMNEFPEYNNGFCQKIIKYLEPK